MLMFAFARIRRRGNHRAYHVEKVCEGGGFAHARSLAGQRSPLVFRIAAGKTIFKLRIAGVDEVRNLW